MIRDYTNISSFLQRSKLGIEQKLTDFVIYRYEDRSPGAVVSQKSYRHHYFEISLDVNESCSFQVDHVIFPCEGNRLIIIPPKRLQTSVSRKEQQQEAKGFTILFDSNFLGSHFNFSNLDRDFGFSGFDRSSVISLTDKQLKEIALLFDLINYEQNEYGQGSRKILCNLMHILFQKAKCFRKDIKDENGYSTLVNNFLHLCQESFLTLHSVNDCARKLSVTPKHLTETVREQTGQTALSKLHEHKIGYAKGLLTQTDMPVKQIAYALGFDNPEYFTVFFKKRTGSTPGKYRQNLM